MENRKYRICDVVKDEFLRFPVTLLANPLYRNMSLEAKFVYTLLLNRLTLSQKNGWMNEDDEVYLIYTREEIAETLNISYKKAIAAFRELIQAKLLEETRQGRGYPNLLYVLKAEMTDTEAKAYSEQLQAQEKGLDEEQTEYTENFPPGISRPAISAVQDMPKEQFTAFRFGTSKTAGLPVLDLPDWQASKNNN